MKGRKEKRKETMKKKKRWDKMQKREETNQIDLHLLFSTPSLQK